jgi:hypothetical protein
MKKFSTLVFCLALACFCLATPALAITVLPDSVSPTPPVSSVNGVVVPGGVITDQYDAFGLMFGPGKVAIFSDPPLAWGGVNASDIVYLISPVEGFFVLPNTTTKALTEFVQVEVGVAAVGTVLLEVFDAAGNLLGSSFNDDGTGPGNYSHFASVVIDGIHSFRVSTAPGQQIPDSWGMYGISFCGALSPVPAPGTLLLLASGLVGLTGLILRRKEVY